MYVIIKKIILVLVSLNWFASTSIAEGVVVGLTDGNPGALSYSEGRFNGSVSSLYQCVFDESKLEYEVVILPQTRAILYVSNGDIEIALPLAQTSDRDRLATFAETMLSARLTLFSQEPLDPANYPKSRIAVLARGSVIPQLREKGVKSLVVVDQYEQAIKMVVLGRIEGVVIPEVSIGPYRDLLSGLVSSYFSAQPAGMYVRNGATDLLGVINSAILTCAASDK